MSYLTAGMCRDAVTEMNSFHDALVSTFSDHGMHLLDNLGRRNIMMSQAQEHYFAKALANEYPDVQNDGRTGQPDIVIESLDKELECKLTSRHRSGAISLQSDFETLQQKGALDYLYVIADEGFKSFCVLFFDGLTTNDFSKPSSGSRGKVAMIKHMAMAKCTVLMGDVVSLNEKYIKQITKEIERCGSNESRSSRLKYWQDTPEKYTFVTEEVSSLLP